MSEQKMRFALEQCVRLMENDLEGLALLQPELRLAREALAQQPDAVPIRRAPIVIRVDRKVSDETLIAMTKPAAVVELTDAEIVNAMLGSNSWPNADRTCFRTIHAVRAVIAAHVAKQGGAA